MERRTDPIPTEFICLLPGAIAHRTTIQTYFATSWLGSTIVLTSRSARTCWAGDAVLLAMLGIRGQHAGTVTAQIRVIQYLYIPTIRKDVRAIAVVVDIEGHHTGTAGVIYYEVES